MFTPRDSQSVLDDIGDKFPLALLRATDNARDDYAAFRAAFPSWVLRMFERDLANLIHPACGHTSRTSSRASTASPDRKRAVP